MYVVISIFISIFSSGMAENEPNDAKNEVCDPDFPLPSRGLGQPKFLMFILFVKFPQDRCTRSVHYWALCIPGTKGRKYVLACKEPACKSKTSQR